MPLGTIDAVAVAVAVLSGIILYLIRSKIRADRLRRAIAMEIRKTTPVGTFKASIAGADALHTPIIDANLNKVHLLTKDEVVLIARYQSYMANLRAYNDRESNDGEISISKELSDNASVLANNAAQKLESNTWEYQTHFAHLCKVARRDNNNPGMTEEEIEQKREELMKAAKMDRESGALESQE